MSVIKTSKVKIRRHRRARGVFVITETFVGSENVGEITWESSNLREALASIMNSKEPGYELDIKLTV